jgi:hypothetical protein
MAYLGAVVDDDTVCDCKDQECCIEWWRICDLEKELYEQELGYPIHRDHNWTSAQELATIFLFAAASYEAMWNRDAYLLECESIDRDETMSRESFYYPVPNPKRFYTWTKQQAAAYSCEFYGADAELSRVVELLFYHWNDSLDWAEYVMKAYWKRRNA